MLTLFPEPTAADATSPTPTPTATCTACDGTGLVAPSPFRDEPDVPWVEHVAHCKLRLMESGLPASSSATMAGLIRPIACRKCMAGGSEI